MGRCGAVQIGIPLIRLVSSSSQCDQLNEVRRPKIGTGLSHCFDDNRQEKQREATPGSQQIKFVHGRHGPSSQLRIGEPNWVMSSVRDGMIAALHYAELQLLAAKSGSLCQARKRLEVGKLNSQFL